MTWKETYSGRRFDLLEPYPEQVCLDDIAHSLARLVRFNGHTSVPYSVAEHAMHVEWLVRFMYQSGPVALHLGALHHDSQEAYVGDMIQPMKLALRAEGRSRSAFDRIEDRVRAVVEQALGLQLLTPAQRDLIKKADLMLLQAERLVLMPSTGRHAWGTEDLRPPDLLLVRLRDSEWRSASPKILAERFLQRHRALAGVG